MRADMAKVIVERPRVNSRAPSRKKGYRKYVQQAGIENLPGREPMLGLWHGMSRYLNEHLGPMRRFLLSNVGRPWNKVHQELCENVSFDNPVQKHVLTHVYDYAQELVEVRGREVYSLKGWWIGRKVSPGAMYVCPSTGLLKIVRHRPAEARKIRLGAGDRQQWHYRDGAWWELRLVPLTEPIVSVVRHSPRRLNPGPALHWDVWLQRYVSLNNTYELEVHYGGKLAAVSARPLDVAETRALQRKIREGTEHRRP